MGIYITSYLLIFFARILDVSLSTIRTIFMTRGERAVASVIGFFEISIWISVAAKVISDVGSDKGKMIAYAAGFATGCYVGITLEEFLAVGLVTIRAIVSYEKGDEIANALREHGFGVTLFDGRGKEQKRTMILAHAKRKRRNEAIKIIKDMAGDAVISIDTTKVVSGAFGVKK